jgi:hypothetical protein
MARKNSSSCATPNGVGTKKTSFLNALKQKQLLSALKGGKKVARP